MVPTVTVCSHLTYWFWGSYTACFIFPFLEARRLGAVLPERLPVVYPAVSTGFLFGQVPQYSVCLHAYERHAFPRICELGGDEFSPSVRPQPGWLM